MSQSNKRFLVAVVFLITALIVLATRIPPEIPLISTFSSWLALIGGWVLEVISVLPAIPWLVVEIILAILLFVAIPASFLAPPTLGAVGKHIVIPKISHDTTRFQRGVLGILSALAIGIVWVLLTTLFFRFCNWYGVALGSGPSEFDPNPAIYLGIYAFVTFLFTWGRVGHLQHIDQVNKKINESPET